MKVAFFDAKPYDKPSFEKYGCFSGKIAVFRDFLSFLTFNKDCNVSTALFKESIKSSSYSSK